MKPMMLWTPLLLFGAAAFALGCSRSANDNTVATATQTHPLDAAVPTSTRPTTSTPEPTINGSETEPRFSPTEASLCINRPTVTIDRIWQVSAPRAGPDSPALRQGETAQVGLRSKFGAPGETYQAKARVVDPKENSSTTSVLVSGSDWGYATFPDDFRGASASIPGPYTVIWTIDDGFVACDGFLVAD